MKAHPSLIGELEITAAKEPIGNRTNHYGKYCLLFFATRTQVAHGSSVKYAMDNSLNHPGLYINEKTPKGKKGETKRTR
jgi:hypothetical protein